MSATAKAKSKKKVVKKKVDVVHDEFDTMDLATLRESSNKANGRLTELRRNRNYYLLERDQVQQFYSIVEDDVANTEAHVRNIESQIERMQELHRNDIRVGFFSFAFSKGFFWLLRPINAECLLSCHCVLSHRFISKK